MASFWDMIAGERIVSFAATVRLFVRGEEETGDAGEDGRERVGVLSSA